MNLYICQDLDVNFEDVHVENVLLQQIVKLLVRIVLQMKSL